MSRSACLVSLCLLCTVASAAPILVLSGPAEYTPGTPFNVELRLVGATGLAGFGMNAGLSAASGTAGTDYSFGAVADPSSDLAYVFNGLGPSFSAVNADPATSPYKVYVGDAIAPQSVSPTSGHELLARFTINTDAGCQGTLNLTVRNDSFLELFGPADGFPDIAGFSNVLANLPTLQVPAVPEPATLTLLAIGSALTVYRSRRPIHPHDLL